MPNFGEPHAMSMHNITAISLKPNHCFDKINLILIPRVRNSISHLTLGIIANTDDPNVVHPFKCPFCPKGFRTKLGLQRHSEVKHNTEIEVEIESDIEIENQTQEVETAIYQIV